MKWRFFTNRATLTYNNGSTNSNVVTGEIVEVLTAEKTAVSGTYTFVIRNTGNTAAVATDNLVVTDTFDPILDPITVQLDGVTLTEGTDYTYDRTTGEFATTESRITVPAATYTQDPETGVWTVTPGVAVLRVIGTV